MTIPRKNTLLCVTLTIVIATLLIQGTAYAPLTYGREKLKSTSKQQGDFNLQNRFSLEIDGVAVGGTHTIEGVESSYETRTVIAGASVTFNTTASGSPPPTYQWKKNGGNIAEATSKSYTISSVKSSDAGTYMVVATYASGGASSFSVVLTVTPAATSTPKFTIQPKSQAAPVAFSVTFTAAASGSPTPTYQWKKNGVSIERATGASYTIGQVRADDAGTYTVVATNAAGSATSIGAVLKVN